MTAHIRYELEDTQANIEALVAAELGHFYYATDTDETYVGLADGTVIKVGEQSALTVFSDIKRVALSGFDLVIPYGTVNQAVDLSSLTTVSNTLSATLNLAGGQITIPESGNYNITIFVETNSNNDVWAELNLNVGGVYILKARAIGDSGSTVIKTATASGVFSLTSGDVLQFERDATDGNSFDAINITIELVDQTIIDGFNFLTDLTPSTETLTGETFDGKPVYRRTLSGASWGAGGSWALGADNIVRVGGYVVETTDNNQVPFPYADGTNVAQLTLDTGTGAANTAGQGIFIGGAYYIFADYTKP